MYTQFFSVTAVEQFPSLERERTESTSTEPGRGARPPTKPQDLNHTREVIFALPSLQLHIKTEHLQAARTPDNIGELLYLCPLPSVYILFH